MKKVFSFFMVLVLMLSLCACSNDEPQASETINDVCAEGHTWVDATCTNPKTCSVCAAKEGMPLGHHWYNGVCNVCKQKDPDYDPLQSGVWMLIDKQKWNLFDFQPDGTCDKMNIFGKPIADYDLTQCVKTGVESLKKQYGDKWETYAESRYHVVKMWDYYYVVELTSRTEEYTIDGDLITVGKIPPVSYLIILNENSLESGENDSKYSRIDFNYMSNLLTQYKAIQ